MRGREGGGAYFMHVGSHMAVDPCIPTTARRVSIDQADSGGGEWGR